MRTRVNDIPLIKPPGWTLSGKKIMVHDLTAPLSANTILIDVSELQILGLPSQGGNSGKWLTTNGTSASWSTLPTPSDPVINIDEILPDQTGNVDKVLKTDGTSAYWADDSGTADVPELDVVLEAGNISTKAFVLGDNSIAGDEKSITVGDNSNAAAPGSLVVGTSSSTLIDAIDSIVVGTGSTTKNQGSSAFGLLVSAEAEGSTVTGGNAKSLNKNERVLGGGKFFFTDNSSTTDGTGKHSSFIYNFVANGGTFYYSQYIHTPIDLVFQRYKLKVYCIDDSGQTQNYFIKELEGYRIGTTLGDFTEYTASSTTFAGNQVQLSLSTDGLNQLKIGIKGASSGTTYRWSIHWEINELTTIITLPA